MSDVGSVRVVVITGQAGAGRRTAGHVLEDLGYYLVDNLPTVFFIPLMEHARSEGIDKIAVILDMRSDAQVSAIQDVFAELRGQGIVVELLYLEASEEEIIRRQESAKRPLPLQGDGRLLDAIRAERTILQPLRANADLVVDTTDLNIHQLGARVGAAYAGEHAGEVRLTVMSFGFKNGLPPDADMVADVRFLPNPHWQAQLRPQTGLDAPVRDYVLGQDGALAYLDDLQGLVRISAPGYVREGKRLATVAIGCTGGKHRSTAMAEEFARRLRADGFTVTVLHRDVGRE